MSESADKTGSGVEDVTIIQMDMGAFLKAEYGILPDAKGKMLAHNNSLKKTAFWSYKKTAKLEEALAEWESRKRARTNVIAGFREAQLEFRQEKARLEKEP